MFEPTKIVGAVLSAIAPDTVSLSSDYDKVMLFHLSRKWVSLYETWNLAFCTGVALWFSTIFNKFAALMGLIPLIYNDVFIILSHAYLNVEYRVIYTYI